MLQDLSKDHAFPKTACDAIIKEIMSATMKPN
jgi:hypothetical protein